MSTPRILTLTACPHPCAKVQSIDPATGTLVFRWLNAQQMPVDSGNSVAHFAAVEPQIIDGVAVYADPSDATLHAAIVAACT